MQKFKKYQIKCNIRYDYNTLLHFFSNLTESLYRGHLTQALVITKIQGLAYMKAPMAKSTLKGTLKGLNLKVWPDSHFVIKRAFPQIN